MEFLDKTTKDARIDIRLRREEKRQFYQIYDKHGLYPSNLVEKWIHRFILSSRNIKHSRTGVVLHPEDEAYVGLDDYMNNYTK